MFIRILGFDPRLNRSCHFTLMSAIAVLLSFVLSQLGDCACHKKAVTSFAFLKYSLLVNFGTWLDLNQGVHEDRCNRWHKSSCGPMARQRLMKPTGIFLTRHSTSPCLACQGTVPSLTSFRLPSEAFVFSYDNN